MARPDVQVNLRRVEDYIPPSARKSLLDRMALLSIGRIKRRTGQGIDVNGSKFTPYSEAYAAQRKASGRNADPPTLLLTGGTLGSLQVLSNDGTRAVVGFAGSSTRVQFGPRVRKARTAAQVKREQAKSTHTFRETNEQIPNALKARWNDQGDGVVPRRHFFGLSKDDRRELMRAALRGLLDIVRGTSLRNAILSRRK